MVSSNSDGTSPPAKVPMGPNPTLLSRKEIDALYMTMAAVVAALDELDVHYIVTGGSLLGAVRQHSILFCDDDIDITIIDDANGSAYERVSGNLAAFLGEDFSYSIRPWEAGDKVRPKFMNSVFLDIFTLRRFATIGELCDLIGVKKNGEPQSENYIQGIVAAIRESAFSQNESAPLCPFWHFSTRKAVELWPKEVYRDHELLPLSSELRFGPLTGIKGPRMPVLLLKRAFGKDCFQVYYQSWSHKQASSSQKRNKSSHSGLASSNGDQRLLPPLVQTGGTWEGGNKVPLKEEHYLPIQPTTRAKRRPTLHCRTTLFQFLQEQMEREEVWTRVEELRLNCKVKRPQRTVYMDGVFDLFHVGHLQAIRQCAALGNRVIIGVTGDGDAADYKRPPIISEADRVAVIEALREVDSVICPCPLVVTEDFMQDNGIDLVVHGFADEADAERQRCFFEVPMNMGKYRRIQYYEGLSTTDIINKIRLLPPQD